MKMFTISDVCVDLCERREARGNVAREFEPRNELVGQFREMSKWSLARRWQDPLKAVQWEVLVPSRLAEQPGSCSGPVAGGLAFTILALRSNQLKASRTESRSILTQILSIYKFNHKFEDCYLSYPIFGRKAERPEADNTKPFAEWTKEKFQKKQRALVRESIAYPCMDFQKSTDINMDIHDFCMTVFKYPYKCRYPHWYPSKDIHVKDIL